MEEKIDFDVDAYIIEQAIRAFIVREQNFILDSTTLMSGILEERREVLLEFLHSFVQQLRRDLNIYTDQVPDLSDQIPLTDLSNDLSRGYFDRYSNYVDLFLDQYAQAIDQNQEILRQRLRERYKKSSSSDLVVMDVPAILCYSDQCGVCMLEDQEEDGSPVNIQLSPCNHCFHERCITAWLSQKRSCPICRSAVEEIYRSPKNVIMD